MMKWLVSIVIGMLLLGSAWYMNAAYWAHGNGRYVDVTIAPGMSGTAIASELVKQNAISSEFAFRVYLKLRGGSEHFQTGNFRLEMGGSISSAVKKLTSSIESQEKLLRVIEGWNLYDIAHEVEKIGIGKQESFLKLTGKPATDYREKPALGPSLDWAKEFPILADKPVYVSLEGYIFPDTYRFAADASPEDVVRKLLKEFSKKFNADMIASAKTQKKSVFDIVTMASVIEREVNGDVDRAKVSDLLWRRYDVNWALQCDSTVKYANGKLDDTPFTTSADRASQSEYNTYQHPGLPLGPISNPGLSSLNAALHPLKNEAWYFLTTPDGEVKYATSLEEHTANKKYMR